MILCKIFRISSYIVELKFSLDLLVVGFFWQIFNCFFWILVRIIVFLNSDKFIIFFLFFGLLFPQLALSRNNCCCFSFPTHNRP